MSIAISCWQGPGNEHLEWLPSALGYWRDPVACDSSTRVGLVSCKQPGISLSYTCKVSQWPREERSSQKYCLSCLNKAGSLHVHSWIIPRAKESVCFSHCSHNPSNSFTEQMIRVSLRALDSPLGFFMDLCASQLSINADRETRLWAYVFFGSQTWLLALFVKLLQLRKLWQALRGQFNFFKLDEAVAGFS